ncbi:diguanylate cyclase/phosphodiesterase (GGDEF & EAL domains) with PAS/PAC sensor [Hydrogenimonas sp.]|nr:diguanylate cyclase/phosphodiesterase (GGDEF & EAL domains) with PAS/PAC sensor [Hydrogenimonas sp.]
MTDNIEKIISYSRGLKLLYVEDNRDAMDSTMAIFSEFFDEILPASDGMEGLEVFKKSEIDLIITDINMPRMNGLQMIKEIRDIDREIPILVLSAHNEPEYFINSIKLGVEGYLLKPIELEQFLGVLDNIVEKLYLKEEASRNLNLLRQYQEVTDAGNIVSKTDPRGIITYVNDAFCEISEYSREELIGKPHNIVRHPDNPPELFREMWNTIKRRKEIWHGVLKNRKKGGNFYYVNTTIKPILDQNGEVLEYIALRSDITDIMNPQRQLHDLVDSCTETIIVLVKIEGFDDIEKFYGHKIIQTVEEKFAGKLFEYIPKECEFERVYALGNGEYAFAKDKKICKFKADFITKRLKEFQKRVNETGISLDEIDFPVSVLVSFSYGKNALENAKYGLKELLEKKQDFIVANNLVQKEHEQAQRNLHTLKMIKRAIESEKIICHFQPIIDNETLQVEKYESLVRLIDEDDKVLSPYFFIETAKKSKYYPMITSMVIRNAFEALERTDCKISINLSALDIEKRASREEIYRLLEIHYGKAHRVVFELLEDENVKDFEQIKSFIQDVKNIGVQIAIDDFGTGYSNFERLLDYRPDILKIDGSLIKNIERSALSRSVVKAVVSFAKEQNILTVAEYVENENIFKIIKEFGIDYSQGYYFGKPETL